MSFVKLLLATVAASIVLSGCGGGSPAASGGAPSEVRLGYFANVTHAPAVLGVAQGRFQKALGPVELKPATFNAGPSIIEAIFAGSLDIAYIGPGPAINGHVKSEGKAVRIISGCAANGVAIVARKDSGIAKLSDLAGKKIATPQFGNTQDLSAKHYILTELKARLRSDGGDTEILNIANAEQLSLFKSGQLDAVWSPEPWGARAIHEAGGVLIDEEKNLWPGKNFTVAVVLVSTKFLAKYPDTVEAFLRAHVESIDWINANRAEAATLVNDEIKKITKASLKDSVLTDAFARLQFSTDPFPETIRTFADWSYQLKIVKTQPDLTGLLDQKLLQKVLSGRSKEAAPK
ncbi:MAG TPA: aliphatic sulfonate ABC transporter substrate-binding protein [Planctomycetota bacterium]|jgi:NitT/TauT family transport system substrate-binding protein